MSQKADLNPPVLQFLLCLLGCAKAVDEHSAIDVIDQKAPAKGGSLFQIIRGKELLIRTKDFKQVTICPVPEEHFKEVEEIRSEFNKSRPSTHGKVRTSALGENFFNS